MVSKLVSRWQTPDGVTLAWKVREALGKGESLGRLGLAKVDGRWDLRGFRDPAGDPRDVSVPVPGTDRSVQIPVRRPELAIAGTPQPLDLSGASLRGFTFRSAAVEDSVLDGADLRDAYFGWSARFARCSFRKCNLSDAYPGEMTFKSQPVQFIDVDFSGSRFNRTMAGNAEFRRCLFRDVRMFRAEFHGLMTGCTFSGMLDDVQFGSGSPDRPRRWAGEDMKGCDFSEATLRQVGFKKIDLARLIPPARDHVILRHASCSIPKLIAILEGSDIPSRRGVAGSLGYDRDWLAGNIAILHRLDLGSDDAEIDWVQNLLLSVDAGCE
jgi:uncharacterized protein YjbI with pentapeptide repeats